MFSPLSALALEFDVLIKRAARMGELPLHALTDTYIALHPDAPQNAQRVDLARLCNALQALPRDILDAPRLLLVADIRQFTHIPSPSTAFRCGRMADGTYLGDLSGGFSDLVRFVSCLCELHRARQQAQRLLAAHPPTSPDDWGQLAFAWGCEEAPLQEAVAQCGRALLDVLQSDAPWPPVHTHASCSPTVRAHKSASEAVRAVQAVAEMGLADRPLHLWLGEGRVADCLSPYSRELRDVLWHWAQSHPQSTGHDMPAQPTDDALYAVMHDFLAHDARLAAEKEAAERTVGIYQHPLPGMTVEMVDLGRTDPALCDPRLPPLRLRAPAPTLVRVDAPCPELLTATLEAFLRDLGSRLVSVTIALPCLAPVAMAGDITLPRFAFNWAGGHKLPVLNDALAPRDFVGLVDKPVQTGDTLLVPALGPHAPGPLESMAEHPSVTCVQLGEPRMLEALHDALWSNQVSERLECAWLAVPLVGTAQGRPTLPCLRSLTAAAIARLRRILASPTAPTAQTIPTAPATAQPQPPADGEPRRKTAWAMRIKA